MTKLLDVTVKDTGNIAQLVKQLRAYAKKRVPALQGFVTERVATAVREDILQRVNGTDLEAVYRKSLTVARVVGVSVTKGVAYTLRVNPRAERITPVMAKKTILFVVPRASVLVPPLPEVLILKHHGPWTPETLPFMPADRNARVFYRTVTAKEADAVTAKQKEPTQRRKIQTLLDQAGYRPPSSALKLKTPPAIKAIPDAAYAGVRAEFGYGGGERIAHWAPSLRDLKQGGLKQLLKSKTLKKAVERPRFDEWKKWPPRTLDKVSQQDTMRYKAFSKRVRTR